MIPASLTLAFALVSAPLLIFCLGFLQPGPGAAAAFLGLAAAAPLFRRTDWRGRPDGPILFGAVLDPASAMAIGSALASMLIYILMAAILVWRPAGLMGAR